MNHTNMVENDSIAQKAELETWQVIRDDTRRRLTRAVSVALLYFLASLAVGSFLIVNIARLGDDTEVWYAWESKTIEFTWVTYVAWSYAGLGLIAIVVYCLVLAFIRGKLPPPVCGLIASIPWIGSTIKIIAIGEFCQSIYQSVSASQSYGKAFARAAEFVADINFRHWANRSSHRIEAGHPIVNVLDSAPFRDQPLSAATAFASGQLSDHESTRVWHRATAECHLLAQSRLDRTTLAISITCMLACVFLASFAVLLTGTFVRALLNLITFQ